MFGVINYDKKPPTLYDLINSYYNYNDDTKIKTFDLIRKGVEFIFNDLTYPTIFDNNNFMYYFGILFVSHYFTRRIGFETFLSFKIQLQAKMNVVMPKYNILINIFNNNLDLGVIDTTNKKTNDKRDIKTENETNGESNVNTTTETTYSDTPQSRLDLVKSGDYATEFNSVDNKNFGKDKSNSIGISNNIGETQEELTHKSINTFEIYKLFIDNSNKFLINDLLKEFECLFYQLA